jgi:hypothetical protein
MEKYKEKQERYKLMYNEATQRNEKIILHIHLEQRRRWKERHIKVLDTSVSSEIQDLNLENGTRSGFDPQKASVSPKICDQNLEIEIFV